MSGSKVNLFALRGDLHTFLALHPVSIHLEIRRLHQYMHHHISLFETLWKPPLGLHPLAHGVKSRIPAVEILFNSLSHIQVTFGQYCKSSPLPNYSHFLFLHHKSVRQC